MRLRNSLSFTLAAALVLFGSLLSAQQTPPLTPDIPAKFDVPTSAYDYIKRDVMIPMRDGVKLHTVIIVPKGAKGSPILLTRTPYDAAAFTSSAESSHMGPSLNGHDNFSDVTVEG